MKEDDTLLGSDLQPAMVDVGGAEPVALGSIVSAAHGASSLTVEEWNTQLDEEREAFIEAEIERQRTANTTSSEPPAEDPPEPDYDTEQKPIDGDHASLNEDGSVSLSFTEQTTGKSPSELTDEERQGMLAETVHPPHLEGDHGPSGETRAREAFLRANPPRRVD